MDPDVTVWSMEYRTLFVIINTRSVTYDRPGRLINDSVESLYHHILYGVYGV